MAGGVRQGIEFEPGCKIGRKPWEPAGLNELTPGIGNRSKRPGGLGCWATLSDELREVGDGWVAGDDEPGAEVVPERDAELGAGLGEAEEDIAAVAAGLAARAATDLA